MTIKQDLRVRPEQIPKWLEMCRGYACRYATNRIPAEDILQETHLQLQSNISRFRYRSEAEAITYVKTAIWHTAKNLRTQLLGRTDSPMHPKRSIIGIVGTIPLPGTADSPLDIVIANEEKEVVANALEKLPSKDREMLRARFMQGTVPTVAKMATELGVSPSTLHAWLCSAMTRLARELRRLDQP